MTGMRVLDIGCCEGFFSFEAERRGASEVIAIDGIPSSIERFNICKEALGSRVNGHLCSVYDLSPKTYGAFDLIMFFGVLYHLRNPLLALDRILSVCTGTLLMQSHSLQEADPEVDGISQVSRLPMARFYPFGIRHKSGPAMEEIWDKTVFWVPNHECAKDMLLSIGFRDVEIICTRPLVLRAQSPTIVPGKAPDAEKAPWS
jgi:tRNA (mo5U34)-methyltransferase